MTEEIGSIDCPDCQLQLLQQQSLLLNNNLSQSQSLVSHQERSSQNNSTEDTNNAITQNEHVATTSSTTRDGIPLNWPVKLSSSSAAALTFSHHGLGIGERQFNTTTTAADRISLSSPNNNNARVSSSNYGGSYSTYGASDCTSALASVGGFSISSGIGGSNGSTFTLSNSGLMLPNSNTSTTSATTSQQSCVDTFSNSTSIVEASCGDFNGYCSTCAVLELPTNEKYYRTSSSRPHVFPSIFYPQGPSSMPCFSPIPECSPWTNEFNHYAYSSPYPPQPPPPPVDYYASTSTMVGHSSSSVHSINAQSSYENVSNINTSNMFQSNYSNNFAAQTLHSTSTNSNINYNQISQISSSTRVNSNVEGSSSTIIGNINQNPKPPTDKIEATKLIDSSAVLVMSSSSGESSDEDDSNFDSDANSSMDSEDRELISVVEDNDDNNNNDDVGSKTCRSSEGRCCICQNPIEITDCSSPQLAKILENIEADISAEDLDITVSSGDIEIGGMEDEVVRDFPNHKKRYNSSGSHCNLTVSRLSMLLGDNSKTWLNAYNGVVSETDAALLCFRCGKLASLADSLESQLSNAIQTLHEHILNYRQQHPNSSSTSSIPIHHSSNNFFSNKSSLLTSSSEQNPSRDNGAGTTNLITPDETFLSHQKQIQATILETKETQTDFEYYVVNGVRFGEKAISSQSSSSESYSQQPPLSVTSISEGRESMTMNMTTDIARESYHNIMSEDAILSSSNRCISSRESPLMLNSVAEKTIEDENAGEESGSEHSLDSLDNFEDGAGQVETLALKEQEEYNNEQNDENAAGMEIEIDAQENNSQTSISNGPSVDLKESNCETISEASITNTTIIISSKLRNSSNKKFNFNCQYCQRLFSTKSNMKSHTEICKFKISHDEEGKGKSIGKEKQRNSIMKCLKCGIGFRSVIRQRKHEERGCRPIIFQCDQCPRRFSKASELKIHVNSHLGEKPFQCNLCSASFSTKGNQVAHMATHSTTKKFKCTQCDKGFNRRFALEVHLNRHNGVKPFGCNHCGKTFSDPSNLKNHEKRSHKKLDKINCQS